MDFLIYCKNINKAANLVISDNTKVGIDKNELILNLDHRAKLLTKTYSNNLQEFLIIGDIVIDEFKITLKDFLINFKPEKLKEVGGFFLFNHI